MLNLIVILALQTSNTTQDDIQKYLAHIRTCVICSLDNKDYKFKRNKKDLIITGEQIKNHKKKFELYNK